MRFPVSLYPGQRRAVQARGRELLLAAEPRAGASHLLRSMAILRAASQERTAVVLAARDEKTLREQHKEGEGGIWRMLEGLPAGTVTWQPGGVGKLRNGSTIQLTTWENAAKRPADVLLVDDADELPLFDFQRLREKALQGPVGGDLPRLVVVSRRPDQGWIREHWRALNGEGARVELRAGDLPERFRQAVEAAVVESFGDWISRIHPAMGWQPHVELMVEVAQKVLDGEIPRLIVSAPPRYKKSLIWARFLPARFLSLRQDKWVSVVSSSATLAEIMSGDARAFYRAAGLPFRSDSQDKALWRTPKGGGMWARGVGGWILGVGMDLGIIDDPFASWEEAQKQGVQDSVEGYFWDSFMGRRELRAKGDGAVPIVVNHQALAEGDLRGRLLKRELEEKLPSEGWHVLNLPALKRKRREPWPEKVTVIPDLARWDGEGTEKREREIGEALCPSLLEQDVEGLLRLEASNARLFAATHLQEPLSDVGGGMFEKWWWSFACPREAVEALARLGLTAMIRELMRLGLLPTLEREARAWDIAASLRGEGDASASVRGGIALRNRRQEIVFTDAQEYHRNGNEVPDLIYETAMEDGPDVDVILPQEPAAAGKILIGNASGTSPGLLQVRLEMAGFRVFVVPTGGSKRVRANPHAGAAMPLRNAQGVEDGRMGRCFLLPGTWNPLFCERHQKFDGVTKPLDLVDAASYLFSELDGGSFLASGIQ